jgi:hypothetical protein
MLDVQQRLGGAIVLRLILRGVIVAHLVYARRCLQSRRPDELAAALKRLGVCPPQRRPFIVARIRIGQQLQRRPALTTRPLGIAERHLLARPPFTDVAARRRRPLRLPRDTTAGQADAEQTCPPDPAHAFQHRQRLAFVRGVHQQDLVKMRVPAVLTMRDLGSGHRPCDPAFQGSPFPALPQPTFRDLHRF